MKNFIKFILKFPVLSTFIILSCFSVLNSYFIYNNFNNDKAFCIFIVPLFTYMGGLTFWCILLMINDDIVFEFFEGDYKNLLD